MYLDKETLCHAVYTKGKLPSAVMQFIRTSQKTRHNFNDKHRLILNRILPI